MKKKMFTIRDAKAGVYSDPVFIDSTGRATRMFTDLVNGNKDNEIAKHPEDFYLYEIGEFDLNSGIVSMLSEPISLGCGLDYVVKG